MLLQPGFGIGARRGDLFSPLFRSFRRRFHKLSGDSLSAQAFGDIGAHDAYGVLALVVKKDLRSHGARFVRGVNASPFLY